MTRRGKARDDCDSDGATTVCEPRTATKGSSSVHYGIFTLRLYCSTGCIAHSHSENNESAGQMGPPEDDQYCRHSVRIKKNHIFVCDQFL